MPDDRPLALADSDDLAHAPVDALQFDGRKAFKLAGESMGKITAARLAVCVARAGFVVMRKPALGAHSFRGAVLTRVLLRRRLRS